MISALTDSESEWGDEDRGQSQATETEGTLPPSLARSASSSEVRQSPFTIKLLSVQKVFPK